MIKTFEKYKDIDPYGEEEWGNNYISCMKYFKKVMTKDEYQDFKDSIVNSKFSDNLEGFQRILYYFKKYLTHKKLEVYCLGGPERQDYMYMELDPFNIDNNYPFIRFREKILTEFDDTYIEYFVNFAEFIRNPFKIIRVSDKA